MQQRGQIAVRSDWLGVWLQAIRWRSFTASAIPVVVGSLLALIDREFNALLFVLMLFASVACQAGANLANDYFDFKKGIDHSGSLGADKVILQGKLSAAEVKRGMFVAFGIAAALGLGIVAETNWCILALALASLAAAYLYTGGLKPLGYVALGEVIAFVFMGPVIVGGSYYAMTAAITGPVLFVACSIGCLVAAIMHANNIRDIETDRTAGKVTLATLLGRTRANQEYLLLIAGSFLIVIVRVALDWTFWPMLATLLSLPAAVRLIRLSRSARDASRLNLLLRKTAGLHLRFGFLLILGLLLRAILDRR